MGNRDEFEKTVLRAMESVTWDEELSLYVPINQIYTKLADITTAHYRGFCLCRESLMPVVREAFNFLKMLADPDINYHSQSMGCGLEDRNITDRYDAMSYGWEKCDDRFCELIYDPELLDKLQAAIKEAEG